MSPLREELAFGGTGTGARRFSAIYTHPDQDPPEATRVLICEFAASDTDAEVTKALKLFADRARRTGAVFEGDA